METNNLSESSIPKRRALGRGLEELFNSEVLDYNTVEERKNNNGKIKWIEKQSISAKENF